MKAIMYHYVRPNDSSLPYFRHLRLDRFRRQLEYFADTDRFVSKSEFLECLATGRVPEDGIVLTFDDGFSDHYEYVLPELVERQIWGVFYPCTGVYKSPRMLDVHRVHLLLGRHGGARVLVKLNSIVTDDVLIDDRIEEFRAQTYQLQDNDSATVYIKRMLNYFISYSHRQQVLDLLCAEMLPDEPEIKDHFYATPSELRMMQDAGMTIGSHTISHPVMSRLDENEQRHEIDGSFKFLENACGDLGVKTFCYPYGGFHSFTKETERLLLEAGCLFSFNVEQRDIAREDFVQRPQALPRYDCNQFPHGAAGC